MMDTVRFVINLEDRLDRRREMELQLRRVGWEAQYSKSVRPSSCDGFPSIGARGCFESHLATLERAQSFNAHVVLMEDDLNFVPGFPALWAKAVEALEAEDWSIFYPAHVSHGSGSGVVECSAKAQIVCAHFVVFNKSAVPEVIERLKTIRSRPAGHAKGGPMHVDGAYSTIRQQNPHLRTYLNCPPLGYQRSSRSDIAELQFFDRVESLRPVVRQLRRIKRIIQRP